MSEMVVFSVRWREMLNMPKNVRKMSRSLPSKYTLKFFTFSIVPKLVSRSLGVKL